MDYIKIINLFLFVITYDVVDPCKYGGCIIIIIPIDGVIFVYYVGGEWLYDVWLVGE